MSSYKSYNKHDLEMQEIKESMMVISIFLFLECKSNKNGKGHAIPVSIQTVNNISDCTNYIYVKARVCFLLQHISRRGIKASFFFYD